MTTDGFRLWRQIAFAGIALCAMALLGTGSAATVRSQASATLSIDPARQTVGTGSLFEVRVMQDADVATLGAQVSINFDPSLVQVRGLGVGTGYSGTELIAAGPIADVVAEANATGSLRCVATFIVPGAGSVPPGPAEFLYLTMEATGASGTSPVQLSGEPCGTGGESSLGLIDESGARIEATTTNGSVEIDPGAAPVNNVTPQSTAAAATVAPSGSTTSQGTARAGSSTRPTTITASLAVEPSELSIAKGEEASIDITQSVNVPVSSVDFAIEFDNDLVQLTEIAPGDDWEGASGASETDLAEAMDAANETGVLSAVAFIKPSGTTVPAGERVLVSLKMQAADQDGTSPVSVASANFTGDEGEPIEGETSAGELIIGSGESGGGSSMLLWIGIGFAVLAAAGAGGYYVWRKRQAWA